MFIAFQNLFYYGTNNINIGEISSSLFIDNNVIFKRPPPYQDVHEIEDYIWLILTKVWDKPFQQWVNM